MRISDWSSDVCSSDLVAPAAAVEQRFEIAGQLAGGVLRRAHHLVDMEVLLEEISQGRVSAGIDVLERAAQLAPHRLAAQRRAALAHAFGGLAQVVPLPARQRGRSEEHTTELQSLMPHTYAVLC